MRLHRFYTKTELGQKEIRIDDEALLNQWLRVFRYEATSQVILFNGDGTEYIYEITLASKNEIKLRLVESSENTIKSTREVCLAFSLVKKDNVEWILQKGTELGVSRFTPIVSERSEKKGFNSERAQKIIIEACEQSGRGIPPLLDEPLSLSGFVTGAKGKVAVFHGSGKPFLTKEFSLTEKVTFVIGPEGGWSEKEVSQFQDKGFGIFSLGNATLRAETAVVAVLSLALLGGE